MTVQSTSIEAYYCQQERFETQRETVYYIVKNAMHPSASDVARLSNLKINAVTGRLNKLEQDGLIRKAGKKMDPHTKMNVYYYEAVDP